MGTKTVIMTRQLCHYRARDDKKVTHGSPGGKAFLSLCPLIWVDPPQLRALGTGLPPSSVCASQTVAVALGGHGSSWGGGVVTAFWQTPDLAGPGSSPPCHRPLGSLQAPQTLSHLPFQPVFSPQATGPPTLLSRCWGTVWELSASQNPLGLKDVFSSLPAPGSEVQDHRKQQPPQVRHAPPGHPQRQRHHHRATH